MTILSFLPSLKIHAAPPILDVDASQLPQFDFSTSPCVDKSQLVDCPEKLDVSRDKLSLLLADDQADPHVDIEAMSEEEFMDYTVAQIRAGKLDLFVTPESNFEDEAIGEHFSCYPFLY